ncbi:hypothetical protein [uncultured Streptococcus sp.]|uniref:hypothetical protein n=1 Tax=uncultured Streptococcus sp. TaxID=83427 RepID=UPI0025E5CF7A|nr:hypothetical protein [uncultured Streptococcus sp.]
MQRSLKLPKQSRFVSCFLGLLFCILNGSNLFVCAMFFVVIVGLLAFDKDYFSLFPFLFLSIVSAVTASSYILIRELLYKLIHYLGYRAQPDLKVLRMRRGLDIHFPVFEKYSQDYRFLYKKRSKKLQIGYLLICLGYFSGLSLMMITFTVLLRGVFELLELGSKLSSSEYKQFLGFLVYMGVFVLLFTGQKYWKKFVEALKKRENVTVLAVEHGYPIFSTKEEA